MKRIHRIFLSYLILSSQFNFALARDNTSLSNQEGVKTNDEVATEVIVTATRFKANELETSENSKVISKERISNSNAENLADLLKNEGIQVSDIGGNKRNFTIDLMGFGENSTQNTLILVDGMKINSHDLSNVNFSEINLQNIEKIEIIKGGSAALFYGDSASSGVINIITKNPKGNKATGSLQYGSYNSYTSDVNASIVRDKYSFSGDVNYQNKKGYRQNSAIDSLTASLKNDTYLTDNIKIKTTVNTLTEKVELPGSLTEAEVNTYGRTFSNNIGDFAKTNTFNFGLNPEITINNNSEINFESSYRYKEAKNHIQSYNYNTYLNQFSISPKLRQKFEIEKFQNEVILGADLTLAKQAFPSVNAAKNEYALFANNEFFIKKNFSIKFGLRDNVTNFNYNNSLKRNYNDIASNVGVKFLQEDTLLYSNFAHSFRNATLDQIYNVMTKTLADISSQSTNEFNFGFKHKRKEVNLSSNFFISQTNKEIFYDLDNFINTNFDSPIRRVGFDVSIQKQINAFDLSLNYSQIQTKILEGKFKNKVVPGVAEHNLTMNFAYKFLNNFTISASPQYRSGTYQISDFQNAYSKDPGFFVLNSKLKYTEKNINAFLDVNNILNKKYSEYGVLNTFKKQKAYYPSQERNILIGVEASI